MPSYNPAFVWRASLSISSDFLSELRVVPSAGALAFGTGVALGAAWGGGWGWGANWGHADININRNNAFVRNANISGTGTAGSITRCIAAAPHRDQATANRFGGTARGDSLAARQAGARQQVSRQGGNLRSGVGGWRRTGERAGRSQQSRRPGPRRARRPRWPRRARRPRRVAGPG